MWKHLEAFGSSLFSMFCTVLTLKRQNSENRELSISSKTVLCYILNQKYTNFVPAARLLLLG